MLIQHSCLFTLVSNFYKEVQETAYDYFLGHFKTIVELAASLPLPGQENGPSRFSLETGPIAPLWFTTMKCREPYIRRRALSLLRHAGRDGYWDSAMLYHVGREVTALEEGASQPIGFEYSSLEDSEPFQRQYTPEYLREIIPLRERIRDARLELLDEDGGKFNLVLMRTQCDAGREIVVSNEFVLER